MKTLRFNKKKPSEESYLYSVRGEDEIVEVRMTVDEHQRREVYGFITLPDGREAQRAVGAEAERDGLKPKPAPSRTRARWPMVSVNTGVNPDQADDLREFWREHCIPGCDVLKNGDVVWADAKARKLDCEARGLYDRNAGYGDPMPKNK